MQVGDANNGVNSSVIMINNGKYGNGGCVLNPYATINDGLIDLNWVHDPSYFGMFGYREIVNDAKANGGIQAYKKHSTYMRGRKIKATFIDPEAPEPEPSEKPTPQGGEGEEETKETPQDNVPDKFVGVDDSDLIYKRSITWTSCP